MHKVQLSQYPDCIEEDNIKYQRASKFKKVLKEIASAETESEKSKLNEKIVVVSHSVFGSILRTNQEGNLGYHLKNCEMVPIDEYVDLELDFGEEMIVDRKIKKYVPKKTK